MPRVVAADQVDIELCARCQLQSIHSFDEGGMGDAVQPGSDQRSGRSQCCQTWLVPMGQCRQFPARPRCGYQGCHAIGCYRPAAFAAVVGVGWCCQESLDRRPATGDRRPRGAVVQRCGKFKCVVDRRR